MSGILMTILKWPKVVYDDIKAGNYYSLVVGLGIPYLVLGAPQQGMSMMEMAQMYGLAGVSVYVVDQATQ